MTKNEKVNIVIFVQINIKMTCHYESTITVFHHNVHIFFWTVHSFDTIIRNYCGYSKILGEN